MIRPVALSRMASKGVYAAMPHPRFGMDRRQYLEEPYWRAMAATIDEARKLNMQIWLYDEYNWPSGGNILAIETFSHHGPAGLSGPIELICGPGKIDRLKSWEDLGFGFYSGRVLYSRKLNVDGRFKRAWLDLGQVQHYVEVFVNGRLADTLLWPPYELDVTEFLNEGQNELVLVTANSIANRFAWDIWGTRGTAKAEPSGILGPAYLWLEK